MTQFKVDVPAKKEPKAPREPKPKPAVHPGLTLQGRCLGCGDWLEWEPTGVRRSFGFCPCGLWIQTFRGTRRVISFFVAYPVEFDKEIR